LKEELLTSVLENFEMPPGRGGILSLKKIKIIDDSYNANPESVRAALDYLSCFKKCRKFFVFGDMKELGDDKESFHTEIGQYAVGKTDILFTVGKLAEKAQSNSNNFALSLHFNDNFSLLEKLTELLTDGDIILIKGSRSMQLDQLINELKNVK
jgi:UDP-N-acetylmuramoyl-tripeptide--D-alanyl-D-alanine ligase